MKKPLPPGFFQPMCVRAFRELANEVPVGGCVVEIGVHLGRSLGAIMPICIKRDISVYAVDIWEPYEDNSGNVAPWLATADRYERFVAHMQKRGWWDSLTALRMRSEEAAARFLLQTVDLIHIDGAHDFASVTRDLESWWPLLKPGGVMIGHDIRKGPVLRAVKAYFDTGGWERIARGKMWKAVKPGGPQ